jgi:hypothetical protein
MVYFGLVIDVFRANGSYFHGCKSGVSALCISHLAEFVKSTRLFSETALKQRGYFCYNFGFI